MHSRPHLAEVVPSVLAVLGVPEYVDTLGFAGFSGACVLLVDGLGWELLEEHAADAPALTSLRRTPLQVGFPSTTVAGLSAIGTGLPSGQHGMVGYSFEVPGTGVINALRVFAAVACSALERMTLVSDLAMMCPALCVFAVDGGL